MSTYDAAITEAAEPLINARQERDSLFQRVLTATGDEWQAALAVATAAGAVDVEHVARVYLELRKTAAGTTAA